MLTSRKLSGGMHDEEVVIVASIRANVTAVVLEDAEQSAREAAEQMLDNLGSTPDLALVFSSGQLDARRVLDGLWSRLPERCQLVGCSSDTEVDSRGALQHSVSVVGLSLDGIEARTFLVSSGENEARGKAAAEMLGTDEPGVIVAFPDVIESNGTRFLLGLQSRVGRHVPIVGGAPSTAEDQGKTYTFCGRNVAMGGSAGFALYGPVEVASSARSGYNPIGVTRTLTKVDGAAILEIDGRPALDVYLEYVGEQGIENLQTTTEFPLGLVGGALGTQKQSDGAVKLVRAVLRLDKDRKALILGGDLPEGAIVRVLRARGEDLLQGAEQAAQLALAALTGKPDLALAFSCNSRRVVLGSRYRDECRVAFSRLPRDVPKGGFYTFGELAPMAGVTMHHESTFTIALLRATK